MYKFLYISFYNHCQDARQSCIQLFDRADVTIRRYCPASKNTWNVHNKISRWGWKKINKNTRTNKKIKEYVNSITKIKKWNYKLLFTRE